MLLPRNWTNPPKSSSPATNLILRSHTELDLTNQSAVKTFFSLDKPQYVILAAAKVGGIHANSTYPADFITINLQIQTNIIDSAYRYGTKKLIFLGSSCIYPKHAPQPIPESSLLTGPLEPTNEWSMCFIDFGKANNNNNGVDDLRPSFKKGRSGYCW